MDYWSSLLVSLLLAASGAGLMVWHAGSWRAARAASLEAEERDYRRRQYYRRMQTSAMLVVLGVAIFVGQLLTPRLQSRLFALIFWGGVLVLVAWMALLALADLLATQHHFSRLRTDCLVQRAKLQAELRRAQAAHPRGKTNGQARKTTDGE